MERSSRRKRKSTSAHSTDFSASFYVGYTEDNESVEQIMKKFEELENFKKEQLKLKSFPNSLNCITTENQRSDSEALEENDVNLRHTNHGTQMDVDLNQSDLEEIFKRTSSFTVKSANLESEEQIFEFMDFNEEEENDYQIVDDDFWDQEFGIKFKNSKSNGSNKGNFDKQGLINRYKLLSVQMKDKNGNIFLMKKKVIAIDPSLPTYVKIPANPISRSWVKHILNGFDACLDVDKSRYFECSNLLSSSLKYKIGNNFQVILMDPPLVESEKDILFDGQLTVEQFGTLDVNALMEIGFLFIWTEKEFIPNILQFGKKWGFRYIENFCWIKKKLNNKIDSRHSNYFNKSKTTCLIFRSEDGDIDIRHQRSPDCEFDFIKPKSTTGGILELTEEKPRFMYEVIETLLPQAIYSENNSKADKMLEL
ncbi:hypothetical protein HDU92_003029 [Lobulomyces angularis]|nr:hypothetical protein HDU92_003029 [Lobulomyces angularis]